MSERTEQLILLLTPEEKARVEQRAHETNQTPAEYVIDLINEDDALVEFEEDSDEDILEGLRQGLRDVKAGRTREINSIWDILNEPDNDDD